MKTFCIFSFVATLLLSLSVSGQSGSEGIIYRLNPGDTMSIDMIHVGCFGGTALKFQFYTQNKVTYGIRYKSQPGFSTDQKWEADTLIVLNKKGMRYVEDYENAIKDYKPSANTHVVNGGAWFKISTNRGFSSGIKVDGADSFPFGDKVKKLFRE